MIAIGTDGVTDRAPTHSRQRRQSSTRAAIAIA